MPYQIFVYAEPKNFAPSRVARKRKHCLRMDVPEGQSPCQAAIPDLLRPFSSEGKEAVLLSTILGLSCLDWEFYTLNNHGMWIARYAASIWFQKKITWLKNMLVTKKSWHGCALINCCDFSLSQNDTAIKMIILASPSISVRKRWQQALSGTCPIHEVDNQMALREALALYTPAVLLVDSELIRHRGIRQLARLCQASSDTRTIFFSDNLNDKEGIAVLKSGARGYCAKSLASPSLKKAVCAVKKGEIWTGRRLISLLVEKLVTPGGYTNTVVKSKQPLDVAGSLGSLSPRELDVASMISIGEQNKLISSHLSISEKTVKAHVTNIFKKLGVSSRTQLALFVRQHDAVLADASKTRPFPSECMANGSLQRLGGIQQ